MVDTLNRYGVPLPANAGRGGILQPKQRHKYRVRFINFGPVSGGLDMTQQLMTTTRPKIDYDPIQLDSYNSRVWVAGKHTWQEISVTLRDDITNSVANLVGYQVQKQMNHFEQTTPAAGINYKFTTFIEHMDGSNDGVLEQWKLEGCFITNFDYGDTDYSSGDPLTLTLSIRYDNAYQSSLFPETTTGIPGVRA